MIIKKCYWCSDFVKPTEYNEWAIYHLRKCRNFCCNEHLVLWFMFYFKLAEPGIVRGYADRLVESIK